MLFRPYFLGIIVFSAVLFLWETSIQAQSTIDITRWKDAKNADDIPEWTRRMLIRDFRDVTGAVRDEMLAKTLSALKDIFTDSNVVPSTRYNAIFAAGQLVSTEASPGNLPVAYSAALSDLINAYQDTDSPPYLKYGALLGIVRHAVLGIAPAQQDGVVNLFLQIITELETDEFASDSVFALPLEPAVWDWFQQTALDGLSAMKTAGTDGKVIQELLAVINRQSQELEELMCHQDMFSSREKEQVRRTIELASKAAKTLGDLDYKLLTDIDEQKIIDSFVALAKVVCNVESKIIADSTGQRGTSPDPATLIGQIVADMKICTQSIVWGIQCRFLTSRWGENSFYAALVIANNDKARNRLDRLLKEIGELSTFFDEGDKTNRQAVPLGNMGKAFKFDLRELGEFLENFSESLSNI